MSKYSSYKEHQLITENWRKFLAEEQPDPHSALEELRKQVPGLVVTEDPNGNQVISPTPDQSSDVLKAIYNLGGDDSGLSVQTNADGTLTVFPAESAELEEGWDDIKAGAGKAWKKVKGSAEDAVDAVKQTADDIRWSPKDLGASVRRRRKAKHDAKRAENAAWEAEYDAENVRRDKEEKMARAGREKEKAFKAKHGMSREDYEAKRRRDAKKANRDYMRSGPTAKEKARQQRVKDEIGAEKWQKKQRELAADRPKSNTAYVGSGGVGSSKRYNEE